METGTDWTMTRIQERSLEDHGGLKQGDFYSSRVLITENRPDEQPHPVDRSNLVALATEATCCPT